MVTVGEALESKRTHHKKKHDAEIVYRRIKLEQDWKDIKEAIPGVTSQGAVKKRFTRLAEDQNLIQSLIAEYENMLNAQEEDNALQNNNVEVKTGNMVDEVNRNVTPTNESTQKDAEEVEDLIKLVEDEVPTLVNVPLKQDNPAQTNFLGSEGNAPTNTNHEESNPSAYRAVRYDIFGRHKLTPYNRDLVEQFEEIIRLYAQLIEPVNIPKREALYETMVMIRERSLPLEWVNEAIITVSKKQIGKRHIGYVIGLVRNWCTNGRGILESQVERTTIDFIRKQLGHFYSKNIEQEVIRCMGVYGPVETMVRFHEAVQEFDISQQILTAFRKNIQPQQNNEDSF